MGYKHEGFTTFEVMASPLLSVGIPLPDGKFPEIATEKIHFLRGGMESAFATLDISADQIDVQIYVENDNQEHDLGYEGVIRNNLDSCEQDESEAVNYSKPGAQMFSAGLL